MYSFPIKQQIIKNLPFLLLTMLLCSFFFLEKSEHRIFSYLVYGVTFFTFRDSVFSVIKTIIKDYKLFALFLCYAFFLSLFHSVPDVFQIGETIRLITLPLLFLLTCVLTLDTKEKWNLLFQVFVGTGLLFGIVAVIKFYLIGNGSFLSYPRYEGPGRLSNANIAGFVYGVVLILFLSQYKNIKEMIAPRLLKKLLPFLVIGIFMLVILGTQSRNSLLSVAVTATIFLLMEKKYKLLLSIIVSSTLIFMFVVWHQGDFSDFLSRGSNFRTEIWQHAIFSIKDNVVLGHGYQSIFTFTSGEASWISPHNLFLGLTYQLGVIGLLLFILMALDIFYKNYTFAVNRQYTSIILLISFGVVFSIFEMRSIFLNLSYEWIVFWLPIAFTISQGRQSNAALN